MPGNQIRIQTTPSATTGSSTMARMKNTFTAAAGQTAFALGFTPLSSTGLLVFVAGSVLDNTMYTYNAGLNTINLIVPCLGGEQITIKQ